MHHFDHVIIGQKAFIVNENLELLIIKRDKVDVLSGYWDVPGGKVEVEDTLFDAIKREIKEEVNLNLDKIILTLSSSKFIGKLGNKPTIIRNIYLVKAKGKVRLSKEHSEFKWINMIDLKKYRFPDDEDWQWAIKKLPKILKLIRTNQSYSTLI